MAQALIRIDQINNPIPVGVAGVSRDDILVGELVTVRNGNTNGVRTRRWVLKPPLESAVALSSTDSEAPTFTPDVAGTYLIKLSVNAGIDMGLDGDEVDQRAIIVPDPAGHRHPHSEEAAEANYQVAPGVFNKEGWSPAIKRMLQSHDIRSTDPLEVTVADGDSEVVEVTLPSNMDEGVLQYLRVLTSTSADSTIRMPEAGLLIANFDASGGDGFIFRENHTICGDAGKLVDHKFTIEVSNDGGASSDYQIWLRVKAT